MLRSSLLVFLAGACYGGMAPVVKMAYEQGFDWAQTTVGQTVFAAILFAVACMIQRARGICWVGASGIHHAKLILTGVMSGLTTVFYSIALATLPVAVALTLLFQFTWMGIVAQAIITRRPPRWWETLAAAVVVAGTLLASGLAPGNPEVSYDLAGMAFALASAVTYTLFVVFSSSAAAQMPSMQRGFEICGGALVVAVAVAVVMCPSFLVSGEVLRQAPFGFTQGMFALFLPVLLFGWGGPALPAGVVSVLASSELPTSIVLSYLILGEAVSSFQVLGVALILAGVVVSQYPALTALRAPRADSAAGA
ncbi:DMT family transporter [Berryella wangjianweii]|uniref:DMT family transporter n=1 Tax=Berryella wangjianweii TaxID=2734634 RepID=A0A6M8IXL3_9ACTN|nr:DMT family transporter [Berryella wangjianweii]QKF07545.1 DMT family transporter [Berryella wangjianweii]